MDESGVVGLLLGALVGGIVGFVLGLLFNLVLLSPRIHFRPHILRPEGAKGYRVAYRRKGWNPIEDVDVEAHLRIPRPGGYSRLDVPLDESKVARPTGRAFQTPTLQLTKVDWTRLPDGVARPGSQVDLAALLSEGKGAALLLNVRAITPFGITRTRTKSYGAGDVATAPAD